MSNQMLGKTDTAWNKLFEEYRINEYIEKNGSFHISADQIRKYREPRLMAKFNHSVNLPKIFKDNKLGILPVTRGKYILSHFNLYHEFEDDDQSIKHVEMPSYLQSIDSENITSEAIALNCAVACKIFDDFLGDDELVATVAGRMSSGQFNFSVNNVESGRSSFVEIDNSQIEIDAAYEGIDSLAVVEAKRDLSDDFLIRQLYYPFRTWSNRVSKTVKPIYFVYTNGIFKLYEYEFEDPQNYNSLKLIKQSNYSFEDTHINLSDIENIGKNVRRVPESSIPFPQADEFDRIINLCELLEKKFLTKEDVTDTYAFDKRQTDYYTNAARYLGLIKKEQNRDGFIELTSEANIMLRLPYKQRQLKFCELILSHSVFNAVFKRMLCDGRIPDKEYIVREMVESHLYKVESDSTYRRRASTISGWINWIISIVNEE